MQFVPDQEGDARPEFGCTNSCFSKTHIDMVHIVPRPGLQLVRRFALLIALSGLAAGCRTGDVVCPTTLKYAIALRVVDSVMGMPPGTGSAVVATSGVRADTALSPSSENVYLIGLRRSGVFTITVETPGYRDWSSSGVVVAADDCGVPQTVLLTARIQR